MKQLPTKIEVFDTETTSLNALEAQLVGIAFSWEVGTGYYLSLPEDKMKPRRLLKRSVPSLKTSKSKNWATKYDLKVLSNYNLEVRAL